MTCETCEHWQRHTEKDKENYGFCRRYAPQPTVTAAAPGLEFQIIWPSTGKDDFCGEHRQRHNS